MSDRKQKRLQGSDESRKSGGTGKPDQDTKKNRSGKTNQENQDTERNHDRKQNRNQDKEPRRKPKYGLLSCVVYIYRFLWSRKRVLVWVGLLYAPMNVALSALELFIPTAVIGSLEHTGRFSVIALVILGLLSGKLLLQLGNEVLGAKKGTADLYTFLELHLHIECHKLDRDAYLKYDKDVVELDQRADSAVMSNHSRAVNFPMDVANIAALVMKFILFGSVISMLSPWIILLLVLGSLVNMPLSAWVRKRNYETVHRRDSLTKKIDYLVGQAGRDLKYGKDIRLYHMGDYLSELMNRLLLGHRKEDGKVEMRSFLTSLAGFLVVLIRDSAAYAFLLSRAAAGEMDAAGFVLYFNAISQMSEFVSGIIWWWSQICQGALEVSDYRECLETRGRMNMGEGIPVPCGSFSVEFKNVTFRYPKGEKNVLENVSFKLEAGEKIALVGLNGAGKTTLTKLMCGLLLPDEGEVLLDGKSIFEYNRDEMYSLFGLIPQNYHLLPVSIACNIACTDEVWEIDQEKLNRCIRQAGLEEKIASLPLKADTPLNRQVNQDGVDLSGGEIQKLLLARLLYRGPRCMILDEPTAALDPIAEDRMYRKYNEIVNNATSVFISHRLASTRFCERILLLDGTGIAETGSHEELMAAGGKYRELFEIQSRYYQEQQAGQAGEGGQEIL